MATEKTFAPKVDATLKYIETFLLNKKHDQNAMDVVYLRMLFKILLGKNLFDGTWRKKCPSFPHKGSLEHLYN